MSKFVIVILCFVYIDAGCVAVIAVHEGAQWLMLVTRKGSAWMVVAWEGFVCWGRGVTVPIVLLKQ